MSLPAGLPPLSEQMRLPESGGAAAAGAQSRLCGQCDGFLFEYFTLKQECLCIELPFPDPSDQLETVEEAVLESVMESKVLEQADGFFFPEERLTALYYRLHMKRGVPVRYPVVSCNHTPEYLRGFYPRPAGIDLGPRLLAGWR